MQAWTPEPGVYSLTSLLAAISQWSSQKLQKPTDGLTLPALGCCSRTHCAMSSSNVGTSHPSPTQPCTTGAMPAGGSGILGFEGQSTIRQFPPSSGVMVSSKDLTPQHFIPLKVSSLTLAHRWRLRFLQHPCGFEFLTSQGMAFLEEGTQHFLKIRPFQAVLSWAKITPSRKN